MDKIKNAVKDKSIDEVYKVESQYKAEVSLLKMFIEKFSKYVGEVVRNNPNDKTRKTDATVRIINDILNETESKKFTSVDKIKEIYKIIDQNFSKKEEQSLYGEGVNGFRLDDVLNPKEELDLKDLLSELGVTN